MEDDSDEETDVEEEQTSISKEDEAILEEGGIIGIIEIPSIDIRYPVMEGTGVAVLNAGIGHIPETARIGESGNCVLCGHNGSRYGTFFTPLNQISIGDDVTIIDKNGQTHGTVASQLVAALLAVSCVTVTFCVNLTMVQDKANGARKDFNVSPISRSTIYL